MEKTKIKKWIPCGIILVLSIGVTHAVVATPSSISLQSSSNQPIVLSSISGSVSISNPKPTVATVAKINETTYRVQGISAGTTVISFKDKKTTSKVNITVTSQGAGGMTGRLLASNCFQCHATNGKGGFDQLAGKPSNEIYSELKKFSTGNENADGIMAAHAMGFSDDQIQQIAKYLSSIQ